MYTVLTMSAVEKTRRYEGAGTTGLSTNEWLFPISHGINIPSRDVISGCLHRRASVAPSQVVQSIKSMER
jgi:hypothetical protein